MTHRQDIGINICTHAHSLNRATRGIASRSSSRIRLKHPTSNRVVMAPLVVKVPTTAPASLGPQGSSDGKKRASDCSEKGPVVPAQKLQKLNPASAAAPAPVPKLPPRSDTMKGCKGPMKHVVQYVLSSLPTLLRRLVEKKEDQTAVSALCQHGGLAISSTSDLGGKGFKAPYKLDESKLSIRTTNVYEAGCNITWLSPGLIPHPSGVVPPTGEPSW